jgi:cell division protein FtsA
MAQKILVGIDIGTASTRVAVFSREKNSFTLLGMGCAHTHGVRNGYVTHQSLALPGLQKALADAEKHASIKRIDTAYLAIGGISLSSSIGTGIAVISRADSQVTSLDIDKAISEAEKSTDLTNKKIIHALPIAYKVDGKEVYGSPVGSSGVKLEVKVIFITAFTQHVDDLLSLAHAAGLRILGLIAAPLAGATLTLDESHRVAGCVLVNIGAETLTAALFENGVPHAIHTFQIGGTAITNDIALGLKISLTDAEEIKRGSKSSDVPKRKLDEIIDARFADMFEIIDAFLKKHKRQALLPAGIIITGGGAKVGSLEALAKQVLRLPARMGEEKMRKHLDHLPRDSQWFVACGIPLYIMENSAEFATQRDESALGETLKRFFKQLLP